MAAVDVLNRSGETVSQADLPDEIFSIPVKKSVLHQVVRSQMASKRSGTAKTLGRSEITGSTKKLYRQKGTGNARPGDIKSPLRRGGGVVFGPTPRSFAFKVPKKVRSLALKMALSAKLASNELFVIDSFGLDQIKTREFDQIINNLGLKNLLVVIDSDDQNVVLSARNIPDVKVIRQEGLNVYDILKYDNLLLLEASIDGIKGRLLKNERV